MQKKADNEKLLSLLYKGPQSFEKIAQALSLEKDYAEFLQESSKVRQIGEKMEQKVFGDFFNYLMVKICFPEGLD